MAGSDGRRDSESEAAEVALQAAARSFRDYYQSLPGRVDATQLLRSRALVLYWALGLKVPEEFARTIVADRLAASREMALGYLYERVLEMVGGARKLTNVDKKTWKGIDFRREVGRNVDLINLKSARATSNGDISSATMRNLAIAAKREQLDRETRSRSGEDNPLSLGEGRVRAVRAIARGNAGHTTRESDGEPVEIYVGDELWKMLGAGDGFGRKIQDAIGATPVDAAEFAADTQAAERRVVELLQTQGCIDAAGELDWPAMLDAFPDV